jgi:hypothetical protein
MSTAWKRRLIFSTASFPLMARVTDRPAPSSSSMATCWFKSLSSARRTRAPWMAPVTRDGSSRGAAAASAPAPRMLNIDISASSTKSHFFRVNRKYPRQPRSRTTSRNMSGKGMGRDSA